MAKKNKKKNHLHLYTARLKLLHIPVIAYVQINTSALSFSYKVTLGEQDWLG